MTSRSAFPSGFARTPKTIPFDLKTLVESVVTVKTQVPEHALTAEALGTERSGHGVVIDENGLVLTIGYVITEAETLWIVTAGGQAVQGDVVAYDQASGFGLVQPLGRLPLKPIPLGDSSQLTAGTAMILVASGGIAESIKVIVSGIREFAGYWEYLLEKALFTMPAHPSWGGAALIGQDGKLYGIGSLIVQAVDRDGKESAVNMIIPINELIPIRDELQRYGRRTTPARPWLGWFIHETGEGLVVADVVDHGPAAAGGVQSGDIIVEINGTGTPDLASVYRAVWNSGQAWRRY